MTTTDIINARKGRKVRNTDKLTCITEISDIMTQCCLIKGQRKEGEELMLLSGLVYDRMMQLYSGMTLEEMRLACHEGIYTGNFKSVSPETIILCINSYKQSPVYGQARWEEDTVDPAYRIEDKSKMTEDEAARWFLRRDYDAFYSTGTFPQGVRCIYPRAKYCYDYLVKKKAIGADDWKNYTEEGGRAMRRDKSLFDPSEANLEDYSKLVCLERYIQAKVENKRRMTFEEVGDLPE